MLRLLLVLVFIAFLQSCERRTVVQIEGGNPPVFALSGSGRLGEVIIFAPEQETKAASNPFDDTHALWRIAAESKDETAARPVEQLGRITYGLVPQGYKQIKPETGQPPQLVPGKRYRYWFVTVNAPHASGYFEIQGDRAVPVNGP